MDPIANPFAALTLIVPPAILTNASSLLIMSTSNRLARAADRARDLAQLLEQAEPGSDPLEPEHMRELTAAEERSILLVGALRCFYTALGGFASAAFLSLIGAVIFSSRLSPLVQVIEVVAVTAGVVAVGGLLTGCSILLRETRIAVAVLRERADRLREKLRPQE